LESTSVSPDYFTTLGIPIMSGRAFLESDAPPSNKAGCAAQKRDIYKAILGTSGRPVGIGLLLGLAITVATWSVMAPLLRDQEFSFNAAEPFAYVVTAALLACVAVTAMLIPARRATMVDPMVALREE
jgi:hypothetical protein